MIKSIEASGRTEDEAIESALSQLGLQRDDVTVEILERAKSGFLGLKSSPAVVRVSYACEEETEPAESRAEQARKFITGLLEKMEVAATATVTEAEEAINVVLESEEPGAVIGRRGETLDAIQHLTNYVVNRGSGARRRVNVDAENYRERRNESLESLAHKMAEKAKKYRRNMTLEPMNSYERHVIHATLQEVEGISTHSVGTEPNRRVVVAYERGARDGAGERPQYREWR